MSAADAYNGVAQLLKDIDAGNANDLQTIFYKIVQVGAYNAVANVFKDISAGRAPDLAAALQGVTQPSQMTDVQVDALAATLSEHLGDDLADVLGRKLIKEGTPS